MGTLHIESAKDEIANIVLMPGDPLRARFIATTYLENVVEVNSLRNMLGFTGYYKGIKVSVMGSGMGMPSIGIYSYELFTTYNVDIIIRLGSCGAYVDTLHLQDVVLASEAYSESSYARLQSGNEESKTLPDKELNEQLMAASSRLDIPLTRGIIHSSDVFYQEDHKNYHEELYMKYGCMVGDMESFALFHNATILHKRAASLLTVSDSFYFDDKVKPRDRETSFKNMIEIALEAIETISKAEA